MALALDAPYAATEARATIRTGALGLAAVGSLGAGAIHAAAIGAHAGADQAVITFVVAAAVQLGLGAIALTSSRRLVAVAIAAANAALLGGWVLAKREGISFVDGMEAAESAQWADSVAAGLAGVAVVAALFALARRMTFPAGSALTRVLAVPLAVLAISAMVSVGNHAHAGAGDDHHGEAATADHHAAGAEASATEVAVPAKPFIPGQPIDLGGVEGVTPEQIAEAELLLAATQYYLPHWSDYRVAEAEGWRSIGDGVTGYEHFVNSATFDDGKILDPTAPESLVYQTEKGQRKLVAAMFMLPPNATLADVPDTGGALMQWHIHDNLCFNAEGRVAGLRAPGGPCPSGLFVGGENPMIHVWITSHPCGPFAALEGIAGGTIADGEARLCDHAHGH